MKNCIFCGKKSDLEQLLYKSRHIKIIYPRKPVIDAHFLLMPIKHRESIDELSKEEAIELLSLIKLIRTKINKTGQFAGYNLISNSGEKAGQEINHAHIHIFCRFFDEPHSPFEAMNNPQKFKFEQLQDEALKSAVDKYSAILG